MADTHTHVVSAPMIASDDDVSKPDTVHGVGDDACATGTSNVTLTTSAVSDREADCTEGGTSGSGVVVRDAENERDVVGVTVYDEEALTETVVVTDRVGDTVSDAETVTEVVAEPVTVTDTVDDSEPETV